MPRIELPQEPAGSAQDNASEEMLNWLHLLHAESQRQTRHLNSIRNWLGFLAGLAVLGIIIGVVVAASGHAG